MRQCDEDGDRAEQRLVVGAQADVGVEVEEDDHDLAVGALDRLARDAGVAGGVDRLAGAGQPAHFPDRPVEGLTQLGVIVAGVQPGGEGRERRDRPVDHDALGDHPVAGDGGLTGSGRHQAAAQGPLGLELMDQRVAPDRELGQVVDAVRLGAAGQGGPDPGGGEDEQANEGHDENRDDLRTDQCSSQHGRSLTRHGKREVLLSGVASTPNQGGDGSPSCVHRPFVTDSRVRLDRRASPMQAS